MLAAQIRKALRKNADPLKAQFFPRFFKTGKGEYGEGDIFLGVTVPNIRAVARQFLQATLPDVRSLLQSRIHEERLLALLLLIRLFERGSEQEQKNIYQFYLRHSRFINNWDLVDVSAPNIVGAYLYNKSRSNLRFLAKSKNLWERRIAIVATLYFIRHNQTDDTIRIATMLLRDGHDLIHKAAGWMLREMGKRSPEALITFLNKHSVAMPRTMLRYAIERLPPRVRLRYLQRKG